MASIAGAAWGWVTYGKDYTVAAVQGLHRLVRRTNVELEVNSEAGLRRRARAAEQGRAPRVEVIKEINLHDRRWGIFPRLRTHYLINDAQLGRHALQLNRNGEYVEVPVPPLVPIGRNNMLLCEHERHDRLRRPFERFLAKQAVSSVEFTTRVTETAISCITGPQIQTFVERVVTEEILGLTYQGPVYFKPDYMQPQIHGRGWDELEVYSQHDWEGVSRWDRVRECLVGSTYDPENGELSKREALDSAHTVRFAGSFTSERFIEFLIRAVDSSMNHREPDKDWGRRLTAEWQTLQTDPQPEQIAQFVAESRILEAIYQEAARLFPIFPTISRSVKRACTVDDLSLRPGDAFHVCPLVMQRDARTYERPSQFDPSRFLNTRAPTFLNFSAGQQACIGKHLAKTTAKTFLAVYILLGPRHPQDPSTATTFHADFMALTATPRTQPW